MSADRIAPRLLGAAFLFVVIASITSGELLKSAIGSGRSSGLLLAVYQNPSLVRLSVLCEMANSAGIIALASLLYIVLYRQNRILARIALGWWLAEAIVLTLSSTGAFALIPLSAAFANGGTQGHLLHQAMGDVLYQGVYAHGYFRIHMWFYCLGGLIWYSLLYRSRYVPRAISLYGLIAVSIAFVGVILNFLGHSVPMAAFLPLLPFEVAIGFWLMFKGIKNDHGTVEDIP